jgi:hypothetical protein
MNLFKRLSFLIKRKDKNINIFNKFLNHSFKNYSIVDKTVCDLVCIEDKNDNHFNNADEWLTDYYNKINQSDLEFYKNDLIVETIVSTMVDIGSSEIGPFLISNAFASISLKKNTPFILECAIKNYTACVIANTLCSIYYWGRCVSYDMVKMYHYLDSKGYNPTQILAYCYGKYKESMVPVHPITHYLHLFKSLEPGVYNIDLRNILERAERVPNTLKRRYMNLCRNYNSHQSKYIDLINSTTNGRYSNYKGYVDTMYNNTNDDFFNWRDLEFLIFLTAFNSGLVTPLVFVDNALDNDMVAMHLCNLRICVNEEKMKGR